MDQQQIARLRRPEDIVRDLAGAQEHWWRLIALAGEYYNLDLRPIIIVNGEVQPAEQFPLPDALQASLNEAAACIDALKRELYAGR